MADNKKYIFLDADGVLSNYHDTPGSYITHKPEDYGMSVANMRRVKDLAVSTGAKIVLSSNWRKFSEDPSVPQYSWNSVYGKIGNPVPQIRGFFGDLLVGTLPKVRHMTKSQALKLWFEETGENTKVVSYVIFDDDRREGFENSEFSEHFILTDPEHGVTDRDIEQAKWLLEEYHG